MAHWFAHFLDRIFAVAGAFICLQAPMYMQQYGHQLFGRVAELKLHVDGMVKAASLGEKTLPQYIQHFLDSGDPDFMRQGQLMLWSVERYEKLSEALNALTHSSVLSKPFIFLRDFNWAIAHTTYADFQPGITFNPEGIAYGLCGIGIGYGAFYLLSSFARSVCRLFINAANIRKSG